MIGRTLVKYERAQVRASIGRRTTKFQIRNLHMHVVWSLINVARRNAVDDGWSVDRVGCQMENVR